MVNNCVCGDTPAFYLSGGQRLPTMYMWKKHCLLHEHEMRHAQLTMLFYLIYTVSYPSFSVSLGFWTKLARTYNSFVLVAFVFFEIYQM
jgi:hypothetical protein